MGVPVKQTIEANLWDYESGAAPPDLTVVEQQDRLLWCGASESPYANRVVRATFPEERADAAIDEIMAFFAGRGRRFSWWVGPSSAPTSLAERLKARGLSLMDTYEGVALDLATRGAPVVRPEVVVLPAADEASIREVVAISGEVWGYGSGDRERLVAERLAYLRLPNCRGGYLLARVGGKPAGTATYRFSSDGSAVYLAGAATLPEFRGRGLFTALVARRLEMAQERGCRWAVCLARVGTSAPILLKLGFEKQVVIPVYTR